MVLSLPWQQADSAAVLLLTTPPSPRRRPSTDLGSLISTGAGVVGERGNDEACTIQVNAAGCLTATEFDTESGCDFVTIGGTPHQGGIGPDGVAASAGSAFQWQRNGSVTNAGWTICLGETRPQPQSVPCDPTGATLDSFNRPSHVCLVRGWWRHAPMGGPWRCRSQSTRVHVHAARSVMTKK